jgi:hypothetical protein
MEGIRSRNPLAAVCGSLAIPIFPQRRCSFFVTHFAEPLGSQAASVCHSPSCVNCYVRTRTLLQFGETYLRVAVVAQRIYRIHFQCPRPRASTEARHSHSNPVVPLPQCFFRTRCPTPEDGTKGLPIFRMSIPASVTARGEPSLCARNNTALGAFRSGSHSAQQRSSYVAEEIRADINGQCCSRLDAKSATVATMFCTGWDSLLPALCNSKRSHAELHLRDLTSGVENLFSVRRNCRGTGNSHC